jgi:hypothetical protein
MSRKLFICNGLEGIAKFLLPIEGATYLLRGHLGFYLQTFICRGFKVSRILPMAVKFTRRGGR